MRYSVVFLLILVIAACKKEVSNKVDQDKIFTQYVLKYQESTDVTLATATFRFNNASGTRLLLSDPSYVTVDNSDIEWNSETGNYQKEFSGFKPTATFEWVDLDGNVFTNDVNIVDVAFPATIDDFSYADSVSFFSWQGAAPLDSFELVRVTIDGPGDTDARRFSESTLGATAITIDSVRLSQVDSGVVTLILEKEFAPELIQSNSVGGTGVGIYVPTNRTANLN